MVDRKVSSLPVGGILVRHDVGQNWNVPEVLHLFLLCAYTKAPLRMERTLMSYLSLLLLLLSRRRGPCAAIQT